MHVEKSTDMFGERKRTTLVFAKAEMAALDKASRIAAEARELARRTVGAAYEDDDMDTELAHIEHGAVEFRSGQIVLAESWN